MRELQPHPCRVGARVRQLPGVRHPELEGASGWQGEWRIDARSRVRGRCADGGAARRPSGRQGRGRSPGSVRGRRDWRRLTALPAGADPSFRFPKHDGTAGRRGFLRRVTHPDGHGAVGERDLGWRAVAHPTRGRAGAGSRLRRCGPRLPGGPGPPAPPAQQGRAATAGLRRLVGAGRTPEPVSQWAAGAGTNASIFPLAPTAVTSS